MTNHHQSDTRPPAAAARRLRHALTTIQQQVEGGTTGQRWRINEAHSKAQLVRQMKQMDDQATALRAQIAGLENRNRGLRRQVESLTRGLQKRTLVSESLAEIQATLEDAASALQQCQAVAPTEAIADTLARIEALSQRLRPTGAAPQEEQGA